MGTTHETKKAESKLRHKIEKASNAAAVHPKASPPDFVVHPKDKKAAKKAAKKKAAAPKKKAVGKAVAKAKKMVAKAKKVKKMVAKKIAAKAKHAAKKVAKKKVKVMAKKMHQKTRKMEKGLVKRVEAAARKAEGKAVETDVLLEELLQRSPTNFDSKKPVWGQKDTTALHHGKPPVNGEEDGHFTWIMHRDHIGHRVMHPRSNGGPGPKGVIQNRITARWHAGAPNHGAGVSARPTDKVLAMAKKVCMELSTCVGFGYNPNFGIEIYNKFAVGKTDAIRRAGTRLTFNKDWVTFVRVKVDTGVMPKKVMPKPPMKKPKQAWPHWPKKKGMAPYHQVSFPKKTKAAKKPVAKPAAKPATKPVKKAVAELELIDTSFFKDVFRGPRQRLSNYDHHHHRPMGVRAKPRMESDFVESDNELSSATTLLSYANEKRIAQGKSPTRYLNGGYGKVSHYLPDFSAKEEDPEGILNPGFRHGPRPHEIDRQMRKMREAQDRKKWKKLSKALFMDRMD